MKRAEFFLNLHIYTNKDFYRLSLAHCILSYQSLHCAWGNYLVNFVPFDRFQGLSHYWGNDRCVFDKWDKVVSKIHQPSSFDWKLSPHLRRTMHGIKYLVVDPAAWCFAWPCRPKPLCKTRFLCSTKSLSKCPTSALKLFTEQIPAAILHTAVKKSVCIQRL